MRFQYLIEMARNISHRTIDRKMWLSVASLYSRAKGVTSKARPMSRWDRKEMLDRYICGLLVAKSSYPQTIADINKLPFPLYGQKALDMGITLEEIKQHYLINSGESTGNINADNTPNIEDTPTDNVTVDSVDNIDNIDDIELPNTSVKDDKFDFNSKFIATPEWMRIKYDEMNHLLFDDKLGDCDFKIFTTGKGSQGGILGLFSLKAPGLRVHRDGRRIFKVIGGLKHDIYADDFVKYCNPTISLNGNYHGDEETILGTLVHEMCHYADYMKGICPTQGHGPSWKRIAYIVSSKSQGRFSVQQLATAEEMSNMVLDPEIEKKNQKRKDVKKNKAIILLIFTTTGGVHLVNAPDYNLVNHIINIHKSRGFSGIERIVTSEDDNLKDITFSEYDSMMRTYRYWDITTFYNKNIKDYTKFNHNVEYEK